MFDDDNDRPDCPSMEDSMPDEAIRLRNEIREKPDGDFRAWKRKVDAALSRKCGMVSDDLGDACYRDMFDNGTTPEDAADEVLENEGMEELL